MLQSLSKKLAMRMVGLFAALAIAPAAAPAKSPAPDAPIRTTPALVLAAQDLRPALSLDGAWTYAVDPFRDGQAGFHGSAAGVGHRRYDDVDVDAHTRANPTALYEYDMDRAPVATLPGAWIGHAADMRHYHGLVWYQRRFDAPAEAGARQVLSFGAVDYRATIYLNGQEVCRHEGGFTGFACEVTGMLRPTGNRIVVGVDSERDAKSVPPPVTDWEDYGGITRSIRLLTLPETFIDDAWVRMGRDGRIHADIRIDGPAQANQAVALRIAALGLNLNGTTDANGHLRMSAAAPRRMERWSPENPRLYDVEITSGADRWRDRIGFRTVRVEGTRVLLNDKPVFLRGISMHEEELGANPSRRMTEADARTLLTIIRDRMNGNFVRLAHYPHGSATTRLADEMGLIVWSEIPVYWRVAFDDPGTLAKARLQLAENMLRDRNRASILLWSVGNETPLSDARNAFMSRLIEDVRERDPERLVTAALLTRYAKGPDGPVKTLDDPIARLLDVMAVNTYSGWYGEDTLDVVPSLRWVTPADKPLILSEFGAGAKAGLRDAANPRKFTEEFQADYFRATLKMAERIPNLVGTSPWLLKDFRSPRRQRPGIQDGWNRKGLISETGQYKLAFDVLADWYAARMQAALPAKGQR